MKNIFKSTALLFLLCSSANAVKVKNNSGLDIQEIGLWVFPTTLRYAQQAEIPMGEEKTIDCTVFFQESQRHATQKDKSLKIAVTFKSKAPEKKLIDCGQLFTIDKTTDIDFLNASTIEILKKEDGSRTCSLVPAT